MRRGVGETEGEKQRREGEGRGASREREREGQERRPMRGERERERMGSRPCVSRRKGRDTDLAVACVKLCACEGHPGTTTGFWRVWGRLRGGIGSTRHARAPKKGGGVLAMYACANNVHC